MVDEIVPGRLFAVEVSLVDFRKGAQRQVPFEGVVLVELEAVLHLAGLHGARGEIDFSGKTDHPAFIAAIQRMYIHRNRFAQMDARHHGFGHRKHQAEKSVLGEPRHRHGLRL